MVVVWCVQQVVLLEAAFSMSLTRVKTGSIGQFREDDEEKEDE